MYMQFALIENEKVTPAPGLHGTCPGCGSVMIAKCGKHRLWHWAHKGERSCDPWWETETRWHRTWKNYFAREWQEVIQRDQTGEKHIADVRTSDGMVIELQHSHMKPEERIARENFYRNMVWVVDGTRLASDRPGLRRRCRTS
jgi:competence CoiA-like predicted nuclease